METALCAPGFEEWLGVAMADQTRLGLSGI
jgi:hypothetical protein